MSSLPPETAAAHRRLEHAYRAERPRLLARLRAAGRSLEEAEDLVHDVYAETMERLPLVSVIRNISAWLNGMLTRRMIDAWRHDRVRVASGEVDVTEDTLREIIAGTGLDPLDGFVHPPAGSGGARYEADGGGGASGPKDPAFRAVDFRDVQLLVRGRPDPSGTRGRGACPALGKRAASEGS